MTTRTIAVMGTFVTIDVDPEPGSAVDRAFSWFNEIEARCSRFDARSELVELTRHIGEPVPVSAILFEAVRFALAVAEDSGGAFDPTVGAAMEARGFNRDHRSRMHVTNAPAGRVPNDGPVDYRDVMLDAATQTITLCRPLMLDLGAVAKGLAIDMAAQELRGCGRFAVNAGGDIFVGGVDRDREPWTIGVRHPRRHGDIVAAIRISGGAVCTSGDYERHTTRGHHLLDPRTSAPADCASATVIAPTAMAADALATAAFVLGGDAGIRLLDRHGVDGLIVSATLERYATAGFERTHTILQDAEGAADNHPRAAAGGRDPGRRVHAHRAVGR